MSYVEKHLKEKLENHKLSGNDLKEELKLQMKQFTKSGYKTISIMCFGEMQQEMKELRHGCILLITSPRLMSKSEQGITFCIETKA